VGGLSKIFVSPIYPPVLVFIHSVVCLTTGP
jgi:hypothetical protein